MLQYIEYERQRDNDAPLQSNYRRSLGSMWYDKMYGLLIALGFTESKADSNLFFKVEGRRTLMLLLWVDALFSRHEGVAECTWNLPMTMEVCSRDPEEVLYDGLQGYGHTYCIEPKAIIE